jgi:hypothetical protein
MGSPLRAQWQQLRVAEGDSRKSSIVALERYGKPDLSGETRTDALTYFESG